MSRPPSRPRTAWKWRNSRDVESLLLRRGGSPDEGKRNPGMVYPAFRSAPCALHQTIVALYLLKGGTASPSPSPLWGGSIAEAKRRRSGWGWVLRCVECAPRSTSTPTPLASLATLPTRGRVFPNSHVKMASRSPDGAKRNPGTPGQADPHSAPLHAGYKQTRGAFPIHVSNSPRSQRCAARRKRVPGPTHCPLFRFPKGMGAPRPASKVNISSALSTRTRVPLTEEHGPPLGAPRGFVSSKELSGSAQERASTRTPLRSPRGTTVLSSRLIPRASRE